MNNSQIQELIDKYRKKQNYFDSIQFNNIANDFKEMADILENLRKECFNDQS